MFKVTTERIRQIRYKGIRKLKVESAKRSFRDAILAIINAPTNTPSIPPPAPTSEGAKI